MSLGCVYDNGICNKLSQRTKLNRLNERDLSLPVSIAHNFIPGLDLNTVVFDNYGYVQNSTNIVKDVLDAGLRRLYLDVYWDREGKSWHLCPQRPRILANSSMPVNATKTISTASLLQGTPNAGLITRKNSLTIRNEPHQIAGDNLLQGVYKGALNGTVGTAAYKCDYQMDFEELIGAIQSYVDLSDTNIAASLIFLHLRPKIWSSPRANSTRNATLPRIQGQESLNNTLSSLIGNRIVTPAAVHSVLSDEKRDEGDEVTVEDEWPSLRTVLYTNTARMVVSYDPALTSEIDDLKSLSSVAFPMNPTISNPLNHTAQELSKLNFTDTIVSTEHEWFEARYAGVSPVLNNSAIDVYGSDLVDLLNEHRYWPWANNQPNLYTTEQREDMLADGYKDDTELAACAVFNDSGMLVANCYSHFPSLCRNRSDRYDWFMTDDTHTYFSPGCPKNYEFSTPASPLEARFVRELGVEPVSPNAWVDFNSLYLPNCWMTGGTNAVCPYNIRQDGRNGIGFIATAAAIAFVTFVVIALFEWDRRETPLIRTRAKRVKAANENFEGVPT